MIDQCRSERSKNLPDGSAWYFCLLAALRIISGGADLRLHMGGGDIRILSALAVQRFLVPFGQLKSKMNCHQTFYSEC
jgi:hypothetical protein